MIFFRMFQHLLPRARAWSITAKKALRTFFESLTVLGDDFKKFADTYIFDDYLAKRTNLVDEWLKEFNIHLFSTLPEEQKRDILIAKWKEKGNLSPNYIQTTLRNSGFDVYVYDWWLPGYTILCGEPLARCGEPLAQCGQTSEDIHYGIPRVKKPLDYIRRCYLAKGSFIPQCGELLTQCGEPQALFGNTEEKIGYPLVNKIRITSENYTALCGIPVVQCGEPLAQAGEFDGYTETYRDYCVPLTEFYWRFFAYVGGKPFGTLAEVPAVRREEFEALCLKLFPTHLWLGIIVKYV